MADPLSILGATASVVQIIDVLARSISTISSLRDQWKDADLTMLTFSTQLITLKAAIEEIRGWMDTYPNDLHHQLVMDLEGAIQCCKVLAHRIDEELERVKTSTVSVSGRLGFVSRSQILMKGKRMTDVQKMIETQTSALTLLLTACNSKTLAAQQNTLSKTSTRKVFSSMKQDSASLICLRDEASLVTGCTDNLSKLSLMFDFDAELFASRAYASVIRNPLKLSLRSRRRHQSLEVAKAFNPESSGTLVDFAAYADGLALHSKKSEKLAAARSKAIDDWIAQDHQIRRRTRKILILGTGDASKSTMYRQLHLIYGNMNEESEVWRARILMGVMNALKLCVKSIYEEKLKFELLASYVSATRIELIDTPTFDTELILSDVKQLLTDRVIQNALYRGAERASSQSLKTDLDDLLMSNNIDYFLKSLDRIFAAGYVPSRCDILHTWAKTTGIFQSQLEAHGSILNLYDAGGRRSERKKWIHVFEATDLILFTVPMSCYNQVLLEADDVVSTSARSVVEGELTGEQNQMHESLVLFDSICNARWFTRTKIVLCFTKMDILRRKLGRGDQSIKNHFPDYEAGPGVSPDEYDTAKAYFTKRFKEQCRDFHEDLEVFYINATDTDEVKTMWDTILQKTW